MKIGFIGLGNMGFPMCQNLLNAGNEVFINDLNKQAVSKMVNLGAKEAQTISDAAKSADYILFSLPNDSIVESVVNEIYSADETNVKIILDMSSISPHSSRKFAEKLLDKNIHYCDCPVSGGMKGAKEGTLTIMAAGEKEIIDKAMPILNILGEKIFYVGSTGCGSGVKMLNNYLSGVSLIANCEALVIAKKLGIDLNVLADIITNSSGKSAISDAFVLPFINNRDFSPKFTLDLFCKDMSLTVKSAMELDFANPIGVNAMQIMEIGKNMGFGKEDCMAVIKVYEQFANIKIN